MPHTRGPDRCAFSATWNRPAARRETVNSHSRLPTSSQTSVRHQRGGSRVRRIASAAAFLPLSEVPRPSARPWCWAIGRVRRPALASAQAVRPSRVGADAPHPGTQAAILYPRLVRGVPDSPAPFVAKRVHHERSAMLEGDSALLKTGRAHHDFAARHRKRTVQVRRRNRGRERGFPLPRPTLNAAVWTPWRNAPRTNRACHGRTRNGCPASQPCVTVKLAK